MLDETKKLEFWEKSFAEKQEMWGFEPSNSAVLTKVMDEMRKFSEITE
jgi:hypothetical protein